MKTTIYLFDDLVEVEIDVEYEATYQSARIYGPAEDCYPAEGEMTITGYPTVGIKYFCPVEDVPAVTEELIKAEVEKRMDRIIQECWDDYPAGAFERAVEKAEYEEYR